MKHDDVSTVTVASATMPAANRFAQTIHQASQSTGISFSYLMAQAHKESNFTADTHNHKSSAAGLFQFTKATWMSLVKTHGAAHGLEDLSAKIHRNNKGEYVAEDAATRQEILDLRRDPKLSAMMAGEYAKDNKIRLEHSLGRKVDSTDLYMAHFLGPAGATKLLKAKDQDPAAVAADLVPQAANKNPNVFYDPGHSPRSVAAVYDRIHHSLDRPMKQYAKMEDSLTVHPMMESEADSPTSATQETQWPFEAAHYPPPYLPVAPTSEPAPLTQGSEEVAYADETMSADRISSPMPSAPGLPASMDKNGLDRLLSNVRKGLFG